MHSHHSITWEGRTIERLQCAAMRSNAQSSFYHMERENNRTVSMGSPAQQRAVITCKIRLRQPIVRNLVFFELFLCYFSQLSVLFYPPTFFSLSFTLQEKTKRVLLIPRRSRAQRTTTTDDPFQALSKRPSLWVVLQVHLSLVVPRDLPQQDVSFFTR